MKLLLLFISLSLSTSQLYAWTRTADFEGGTVGDIAIGSNALTGNAGQATYSDRYVHTGTRSLEALVKQGGSAFGGRINYPSPLYDGDEVWYRAYWYYEPGYDWTTTAQGIKTMRINTLDSSGNNTGYPAIYRARTNGTIRPDNEVDTKTFNTWLFANYPGGTAGQKINAGAWICLEMYVKFSSVPGNGVFRIWQDGKLVFEDTANQTLRAPTGKSTFVLVGNYFNDGSPKTQSAYVDDIVITNQRPSQVDSHGNPMIGLTVGRTTAPPKPPSSIQ